jgi:hypothetical protein
MDIVAMLLGAVLFPVAGLGLILWLDHLERTLPGAVRSAGRRPDPPPILAVPVRATGAARAVTVPAQRRAQESEADQAFSRSSEISLGGSTNR